MRLFMYVFLVIIAGGFAGCGGSGGGNTPPTPPKEKITGKFVDSKVIGAAYSCSSGGSGETNSSGEFTCDVNDTVTFLVGQYALGSCVASALVTPKSLYPNDDAAMLNVSRLLLSVDADGDPSDSITIPVGFSALDGVTVTPSDTTFVTAVEAALGAPLVSEDVALTHLNEMWANMGKHYKAGLSDLAGKKITLSDGRVISLYSDMLVSVDTNETHKGYWALNNGVLVINPAVGQASTLLFDAQPGAGVGITGYGASQGRSTITALEALNDDVTIPYALDYAMLLGKIITTQSGKVFSYSKKMVVNDGSQYLAKYTWSVQNGAVVHKEMCGSEIYAVVYDAAPAAGATLHYYDAQTHAEVNDTVTDVGDISNPPDLPYRITTGEMAGKRFTTFLGDFSFYGDMTYIQHGISTERGSWVVNDGLVVLSGGSAVYYFEAKPAVFDELAYMNFCQSASGSGPIEGIEDID